MINNEFWALNRYQNQNHSPSCRETHHPPDNPPLLIILLPKHSNIRLHNIEQLSNNGSNSSEENRPSYPTHPLLQTLDPHPCLMPWSRLLQARNHRRSIRYAAISATSWFYSIIVEIVRMKNRINTSRNSHELPNVAVEIRRIGGEILGRGELARVNVDWDHNEVCVLVSFFD